MNILAKKGSIYVLCAFILLALILSLFFFMYSGRAKSSDDNKDKGAQTAQEIDTTCRTFDDIDLALKTPEAVCTLDLSNQNLNSVPEGVGKLPNMHTLILTGNTLTEENKISISQSLAQRKPQVGYVIQF